MVKTILKAGTVLYHGTIHDFDIDQINMPCWFSKYKDQAINHVQYKHYGYQSGFLLTYRLKDDTVLYDISNDGDIRMDINSNGNYEIAHKFYYKHYGDEFAGYINIPEQGEIMLVRRSYITPLNKIHIDLGQKVHYCNIDGQNWRMKVKNEKKVTKCCIIS